MKKIILLICCLWITMASVANNVVISNIALITSGGPGNLKVSFVLSWSNGWRVSTGQNNYDGVWVFFKYRVGNGEWQHLGMTGINNSLPPVVEAFQNTGAVKTGAIIHRTAPGSGTFALGINLGVSDINGFDVDIAGYAVEMVYIPQCIDCFIGDGDGISESTNAFHEDDNHSNEIDGDGGDFSVDVNAFDDLTLETGFFIGPGHINAVGVGANFQTGQAFWSMKHEVSQAAYRDFLNTLNLAQQISRTASAPTNIIGTGALAASGTNRNFIEIVTSSVGGAPAVYGLDASGNNTFNEATDGEWVACNFLSWMDLAAYLDWAGLAPMTEIGFERICRGGSTFGPNSPVFGEYAWGSTAIFSSTYTLTQTSSAFEVASNSSTTLGNASYNSTNAAPNGPLRNGIFATATSNRVSSGSSFYGVMEMVGNVGELCITIGNVAGRSFTCLNGNGAISGNGNANASNVSNYWPCGDNPANEANCNEVTGAAGTIVRGGNFTTASILLRVSDRPGGQASASRLSTQGGRGVLYIH